MVAWDGTPIITTPRLVLRTFRRDDLPSYAALNADPEVARWLGGPLSRQYSDDIATWAQEKYAAEGIGLLAVERRDDGAFLGMCGLHHQESYPDDVEVAWRLAREHWGNGYATEAATAWLDHAFGSLGLDHVISITERNNARSLAVMARLGLAFHHEAQVRDGNEVFDAVIHETTRERWLARRGVVDTLAGAWRIREVADRASASDPWTAYGSDPRGVIIYDPSGVLSAHLVANGPRPSADGYLGYWGRYVLVDARRDEDGSIVGTLEHHMEGGHPPFLFEEGPERPFRLSGDRLEIGDGVTSRRVLDRMR
jgi:RimJ/RimL family protein N-acetyltransferase